MTFLKWKLIIFCPCDFTQDFRFSDFCPELGDGLLLKYIGLCLHQYGNCKSRVFRADVTIAPSVESQIPNTVNIIWQIFVYILPLCYPLDSANDYTYFQYLICEVHCFYKTWINVEFILMS